MDLVYLNTLVGLSTGLSFLALVMYSGNNRGTTRNR